jgi:flagellar biosynthesis/type III secretory pathway M-ring protein FliF/YscJ
MNDPKNTKGKASSEQTEPSWQSFWIPIAVFIILAVLFFVPLHCSAQVTCGCCRNDTSVDKQSATIQFDVDVLKLMKAIRCDTTFLKQEVVVSPERIIIQQQSKLWPLVILRIAGGIILLLAFVFSLKYLVPYWTRIAELKDKQRERLAKLEEYKQS